MLTYSQHQLWPFSHVSDIGEEYHVTPTLLWPVANLTARRDGPLGRLVAGECLAL